MRRGRATLDSYGRGMDSSKQSVMPARVRYPGAVRPRMPTHSMSFAVAMFGESRVSVQRECTAVGMCGVDGTERLDKEVHAQ